MLLNISMVDDVVIMAGGSGTRLWPASLRSSPKQFLDPGTGEALIISAIKRAEALSSEGRIVIVTHRDHVAPLHEACRGLSESLRERIVVLPEPVGRNTAPAIAFGMSYLASLGVVLVLAADHLIEPLDEFREAVERADALARQGYLVTFGVEPARAETGYGYIEAGEEHGTGYLVRSFREKPDLQTAEVYVKSGKFYWNSGMFVFPTALFFQELSEHVPEIARGFGLNGGSHEEASTDRRPVEFTELERTGSSYLRSIEITDSLEKLYEGLPSISIDYAVMEQSARVGMVPARFKWNDLGSWDEIAAIQENASGSRQEAIESSETPVVEIDSDNCFVRSEIPVAICGVSDLVVVQAHGKLLICRRNETQLVKQAVERLKEANREDLL